MLEKDLRSGSVGWAQTWVTPEPATDDFYIEQVLQDIRRHDKPPVAYVKSLLREDPTDSALITLRRAQKHQARGQNLANIRMKLHKGVRIVKNDEGEHVIFRPTALSERKVERLEQEELRLEAAQIFSTRPRLQ